MRARWVRWIILGVVTCLMGGFVALVVVGALTGTPNNKAPASAVVAPSTTLARNARGGAATASNIKAAAGAKGAGTGDGTESRQATSSSQAPQTGSATPNPAAPTITAPTGSASVPSNGGATSPAEPATTAPGTGTPSPSSPVSRGVTTTTPSQTPVASPTLSYTATAPAGSSLVYLDPILGEVQQVNVSDWTKSWSVTAGTQSDAAIVVTGASTTAAVSCTISWHGALVATQSGTGQADCHYLPQSS